MIEPNEQPSVHTRRPWTVSFISAVVVTLPAAVIALWLGSVASAAVLLGSVFLIWFVGGGIRRRRLRERAH